MALRVSKAELPSEFRESMIKQFGAVAEPVEVMWHNPRVAQAGLEFGAQVGAWDAADESLKTFAHMAVAAQVGCSWCLDINYFQAQNQNLDLAKASQVPRWRESDGFTPLERDVLEYAEAMTNTPPTVTDELSARLLEQLGPPGTGRAHRLHRVCQPVDQEQHGARHQVARLLRCLRDSARTPRQIGLRVDSMIEDPFVAHRSLLFTVAYEMLGSAADAEDVLQESWLRWAQVDHSQVSDPRAYLIRVVTRQALNQMRTLSRRREEYVGEWLPEQSSPDGRSALERRNAVDKA